MSVTKPVLLAGTVLLSGVAFFSMQSPSISQTHGQAAGISSAENCKPCHQEIYDQWNSSFHAQSIHTPTFRAMLTIFKYNTQGKHIDFCFTCHAPEVKLKGNTETLAEQVLQGRQIQSEGITCTICHSIQSVEDRPDPEVPVDFNFGLTPPYHMVKRTEVTRSAEMCGSCHDYDNPNFVHPELPGTPCCNINRDWKVTSFARRGVNCQSCHMKDEMGVVERTLTDKVSSGLFSLTGLNRYRDVTFTNHTFPGGRSETMLKRAVAMDIGYRLSEDEIKATVAIENLTGHSIPNG